MHFSDKNFYALLGTRIKTLRTANGVSQADMAKACNMAVRQYANAEHSGAGLTVDRLFSIGRSLGTTFDHVTAGLTD